jgi:hypothetical protein
MLDELLEITNLHIKRAQENIDYLQNIELSVEVFDNAEIVRAIDAFIFRYIKLQDFMGNRLFPKILAQVGNYEDSMSLLDILDKLEKLEIIPSSNRWINYREIRNNLTHEYPNNYQTLLQGIQQAMVYFDEIKQIINNIYNYKQAKNL